MRRHKAVIMLTVFAVIFTMTGMISLNIIVKFSQGCPFSHTVNPHAKPRDLVTSSPAATGVVALPASAPLVPEPTPVGYTDGIGSFHAPIHLSIETPPLRC